MNRIDKNFCILDGTSCTGCNKCSHVEMPKKKTNNWFGKLLLSLFIALICLLLLTFIAISGMNFVHGLLEEPTHNYDTSSLDYQNNEGPVPYYDSGFYVYTYEDNPATCGGGECPKSQFGYI